MGVTANAVGRQHGIPTAAVARAQDPILVFFLSFLFFTEKRSSASATYTLYQRHVWF